VELLRKAIPQLVNFLKLGYKMLKATNCETKFRFEVATVDQTVKHKNESKNPPHGLGI
jgi:hypothetical protein